MFYQDGVACYATLQIGECDQIHVMAVTQAQLDQWRAAGVEVTEDFPQGSHELPRFGLTRSGAESNLTI